MPWNTKSFFRKSLNPQCFQEVILLKFLLHHQKLLQQQRLPQPRLKRYVRIIFAPQFRHFAQCIQTFLNSCLNTYSCVLVRFHGLFCKYPIRSQIIWWVRISCKSHITYELRLQKGLSPIVLLTLRFGLLIIPPVEILGRSN